MKINWKVRIANKQFWLSVIPAVLLVIQAAGHYLLFWELLLILQLKGLVIPNVLNNMTNQLSR